MVGLKCVNPHFTLGHVIGSYRHKGLRRFFETGDTRGINAEHAERLHVILTVLDASETLEGLMLPTYALHELSGNLEGRWSVRVRGNWRVTFRFVAGQALDIDLEDYHRGHSR
jgi:proteic killer suppression protein